ncbi:DMT family transporter [Roseovarius sp. S4756]|uniref:DMT family transporter n=1 Tax=Roseovarius maritimus TaxID=3342637 RepID=UPI003B678050
MRLLLLVALAMTAFAANSVLNRAALTDGGTDPIAFGVLRLIAGAGVLVPLAWLRGGRLHLRGGRRLLGVAALLVYVFGFSTAYLRLDTGLGALILFGFVQITMFGGALSLREPVPPLRWVGAAIAFGGLIWLLWPGSGGNVPLLAGLAMAAAGAAWGVYSLAGRGGGDPLAGTAAQFLLASIVALMVGAALALWPQSGVLRMTVEGAALATISGCVTSGLGYALWYRVLPHLAASSAGAAQLSVPILAMIGGAALLGEPLTRDFAVAACLVLGGVALSLRR